MLKLARKKWGVALRKKTKIFLEDYVIVPTMIIYLLLMWSVHL